MGELTQYCPKILLPYKGKPILAYVLDNLIGLVNEIIVVIGYQAKKVSEFLKSYRDYFLIREVNQKQLMGDAAALLCAQNLLKDDDLFAVINGDVIIPQYDIKTMLEIELPLIAVYPYIVPLGVVMSWGSIVTRIREKPKLMVNAGFFVLPPKIFSYLKETDYISKALSCAIESKEFKVVRYKVSDWKHFSEPKDLENYS